MNAHPRMTLGREILQNACICPIMRTTRSGKLFDPKCWAFPSLHSKTTNHMPKTKPDTLTNSLEALIENHSMPEVVASLILISRRCGG
jgi:hypothetical protein